ncbi:MAG: hypothetical protein IPO78_11045 [Saprospiraceae bacterium]|nr:hypothetical protein [Saprospiraceae bacterium]
MHSIKKVLVDNLDSNIVKREYILIIPRNSCEKCREYTYDSSINLINTGNVNLIFIGNFPTNKVKSDINIKILPSGILERQIEIYGITLIHLLDKEDFEIQYINPKNIEKIYSMLINSENLKL